MAFGNLRRPRGIARRGARSSVSPIAGSFQDPLESAKSRSFDMTRSTRLEGPRNFRNVNRRR